MFDDADLQVLPALVALLSLGAEDGVGGVGWCLVAQLGLVVAAKVTPVHQLGRHEECEQLSTTAQRSRGGVKLDY